MVDVKLNENEKKHIVIIEYNLKDCIAEKCID